MVSHEPNCLKRTEPTNEIREMKVARDEAERQMKIGR